jgi:chaperonin GroEL
MSTPKKVYLKEEAQNILAKGVNTITDVVACTLGAQGRMVTIDRGRYGSLITKDGVTVANETILEDPAENIGANMIRTAANATNDAAGDGTTTAAVLTREIYNEGRKAISVGVNIAELRKGINAGKDIAIQELKRLATPIKEGDIKKIATISANNDSVMGNIIAEAITKVDNGVVTVELSQTSETYYTLTEGFQFDRGLPTPYLVTDPIKNVAELKDAYVLITMYKLVSPEPLIGILNEVHKTKKPILIIADGFSNEVLQTLIYNKSKGLLSVAAVNAPGYGEAKTQLCQDMAVLTGAQFVDPAVTSLNDLTLSFCGQAQRIICTKDTTTIMGGAGDKEAINQRMERIQYALDKEHLAPFEIDQLRDRLSRIRGAVAVIRVGGLNDEEANEAKDRVEDAIHATQSAMEEGILPGGGLAFLYASKAVEQAMEGQQHKDAKIGFNIIMRALRAPTQQIAKNAGLDPATEAVTKALEAYPDKYGYGFNAATEKYSNLIENGIIDPAKVSRVALENAVSVALLMLTTDALLVETEFREDDPRVDKVVRPRVMMQKHNQ